MDSNIKTRWLEALRSGDYEQGKNCLRDANNNFCCLGVLNDLYIQDTGNGGWEMLVNGKSYSSYESSAYPHPLVLEWAGIYDPYIGDEEGTVFDLSIVNDQGASFEQIADMIEERL